jgi:hypothetical protein
VGGRKNRGAGRGAAVGRDQTRRTVITRSPARGRRLPGTRRR